jgi:sulfide:quinone oxidoreductase
MLTPIRLTEAFSVSPQITLDQIKHIADLGFKTIISNRPDHEENGQPLSREIEQAASESGLEYYYLPVVSGNVTPEQSELFSQILDKAQKPIFAFCRTGTRCSILWSMGSDELASFSARIARAKEVGYNLSGVSDPHKGK